LSKAATKLLELMNLTITYATSTGFGTLLFFLTNENGIYYSPVVPPAQGVQKEEHRKNYIITKSRCYNNSTNPRIKHYIRTPMQRTGWLHHSW